MSELKAFDIVIAEEGYCEGIVKYRRAVYDKSEADKVIAEKDKQLCHSNHKRCLAMARWCDEVMMSCELRGYNIHRIWARKHKWAMRWKYKWLELAEKFKPNKSTAQ